MLLRDTPRSPWLGVVVPISAVAATMLVIYPLGAIAPAVSLGVVVRSPTIGDQERDDSRR